MKTSYEAILTVMTGNLVYDTSSESKAVDTRRRNKVLEEARVLSASLPQVEAVGATKAKLQEENMKAKSDKLMELIPSLKNYEGAVRVAREVLANKKITEVEYERTHATICKILLQGIKSCVSEKQLNLKLDEVVM